MFIHSCNKKAKDGSGAELAISAELECRSWIRFTLITLIRPIVLIYNFQA